MRLLIVDDSELFRLAFRERLRLHPRVECVGETPSGHRAITLVRDQHPDIVAMDVHMPGLDGFEAVERIMRRHPVPIVMLTADATRESFEALARGALDLMIKPSLDGLYGVPGERLIERLLLFAKVAVARRWRPSLISPSMEPQIPVEPNTLPGLVVIGASTGGPAALREVLGVLPRDFPLAVAVVQHLAPGFAPQLASWLGTELAVEVKVAAHGDVLSPGQVVIAPDHYQLTVQAGGRLNLSREPESGYRPSVDVLMRSAATALGSSAIGIVLSGMGADGAQGLLELRRNGAATVVQDEGTAAVFGMPAAALALGGATEALSPRRIGYLLLHRARELASRHARRATRWVGSGPLRGRPE